ncbi:MAG: hypothetical protein AAGL66_10560, partial [Pseudomonadota bacterium]
MTFVFVFVGLEVAVSGFVSAGTKGQPMVDLATTRLGVLIQVPEIGVEPVGRGPAKVDTRRHRFLGVDVLSPTQVGIHLTRVAEIGLRIRNAGLAHQERVVDEARVIDAVDVG